MAVLSSVGFDKIRARDSLNKASRAYKDNQYGRPSIISSRTFAVACSWIQACINARMYWRPHSSRNNIPQVESPDNLRIAHRPSTNIRRFSTIPALSANRSEQREGIATVSAPEEVGRLPRLNRMASDMDPKRCGALLLGGRDRTGTACYQPRHGRAAKLGLKRKRT